MFGALLELAVTIIVKTAVNGFLDGLMPDSSENYQKAIEKANSHIFEIQRNAKDRGKEYLEDELNDFFAGYPDAYIETIFYDRIPDLYDLVDDWEPNESAVG